MKKLLLLASLALTAIGAWAQDAEDEPVVVTVSSQTGNTWRDGSINNNNGSTVKWQSTDEPMVTIISRDDQNNMGFVKNENGFGSDVDGGWLAFFCNGKKYAIEPQGGWYVTKVTFTAVTNADGVTMTVGRTNYSLSTTPLEFEFDHSKGDDIEWSLSGGSKFCAFVNFEITLDKLDKEEILSSALTKYNFEMFPSICSTEFATEANQAIRDKCDELFDDESLTVNQKYAQLMEFADTLYDKLCKEEISGSYFTFQNRDTGRYLAIGQDESGNYESQMIEDGNDTHAIWLVVYEETSKKFRLHNYETDYDLLNTNSKNNQIPIEAHEDMEVSAPGELFSIIPLRIKLNGEFIYVIEFRDAVENGNYHYIHNSKNAGTIDFPIKWNDAEGSPGSGWFASRKDVNPDGDLAGLLALDNTYVVIFNITQNKYLSSDGNGGICYTENLRPVGVWKYLKHLEGHNDENFALYNEIEKKYVRDLNSAMTETRNSNLQVDNVEGKFETWYILPRNATTSEGADEFVITSFNAENHVTMISELNSMYNYTFGNEPGMYTLSDKSKEQAYNEIKEGISSIVNEDEFDLVKAQEAFDFEFGSTPVIFDMNSVAGPALVRIKTIPENGSTEVAYFTNANFTNTSNTHALEFDHSSDAGNKPSTLFVLSEGKLSSLEDGKYIMTDNNASAITIWESEDVTDNEGLTMDFVDGSEKSVGSYILHYGDYTKDGTLYRAYVFSDGYGANLGSASEAQGWINQLYIQPNWYGYHYNVEYVKTLAVDVDENGFKLWRTPVTVNFGDNADSGAYVVSVAGDKITTALAEKETNYGAGTIFILTKNIVANVVNGDATVAPTAGLGHHAAKAHNVSAQKVYMEIHPDQSPEVAPAGLYFDGADVAQVRMAVKIYDADQAVALDPHSAVIEADKDETTSLQHGDAVMLPLGDSYTTTAISELTADKTVNAVYDLQGRRLAAPRKGINIVNGKKIVL